MSRRSAPAPIRVAGWLAAVALIVLCAHALAYALAPATSALAARLEGRLGGPSVAVLLVGAPLMAALAGLVALWLAAMGVRERHALAPAGTPAPPPIRPWPLLRRALGLFVGGSLGFAAVESYLHMRAGLGFHGLHCLLGPVHRDALPLLAGLSLLAACLMAAGAHALVWARRTEARLGGVPRPPLRLLAAHVLALSPADAPARPRARRPHARGPPSRLAV